MKTEVGEVYRFVRGGHHSLLAGSGEGGRAKKPCNVKCNLLKS